MVEVDSEEILKFNEHTLSITHTPLVFTIPFKNMLKLSYNSHLVETAVRFLLV